MRADGRRSGIALVVAVFAVAVIGALVTLALFVARLDQHGGALLFAGEAATQAAQAELEGTAADFDRRWFRLGAGHSAPIVPRSLGSAGASYAGTVTQLNDAIWMVQATGTVLAPDGDTVSVRRLGTLFKRVVPDLALGAAVTVEGSAAVDRSATVDGADMAPVDGGWPLACTGRAVQDVVALSSGPSDPSVIRTILASDSEFARLAAIADITVGPDPVVGPALDPMGQACAMGADHPGNWGDPLHRAPAAGGYPCDGYFPIIRFAGPELRLTDVAGQGILLVDGDLRIGDNVAFYGVVLVRGRMVASGGGTRVSGAVVAKEAVLGDPSAPEGSVTIGYSSCAIARALSDAARVQPVVLRSFVQY